MTWQLKGSLVVDFSRFLPGPLCALKPADPGARVIRTESPGTGDLRRTPYLSDTEMPVADGRPVSGAKGNPAFNSGAGVKASNFFFDL